MKYPVIPDNEIDRLQALHSYEVLYTDKDVEFDNITKLATQLTDMPISLVSLVDKDEVWFKSTTGMEICSSKRELSFCSHAIGAENHVFILEDLRNDAYFHDHPYVTLEKDPIQFYAGVCLIDSNGYALGTLCVIDNKPNSLSQDQIQSLQMLGRQIVKLIELHKRNSDLQLAQQQLREKNNDLREFAGRVSHDMKMPLANMIVTTDILKAKYATALDDDAKKYLNYLKDSSFTLSDYISGLLSHYESDDIANQANETFDIHHLLEEIIDLLNIKHDCEVNFPDTNFELNCNRAALEQILLNLIGNSLKYNDKDTIIIDIDCYKEQNTIHFTITDNGVGIPEGSKELIFELFSTIGNTDRNGKKGNGIGLSTVKKLVENLGGTISLSSEVGKGTSFHFSVIAIS